MNSDTPRLDKLFDMVAEREGPCKTGAAPSKWSYEAILDLTDFARTLERENAALAAEVSRLTENQRLQDSATAAVMERNENLTARVAELERALAEVCTVLESDIKAIVDTIWVSTGAPETLLDHCRAALDNAARGQG